MRDRLEAFMLVLAIGSVVAIGAKRLRIPYNVALVVMGLLLVLISVLPHTPLDPDVILVIFLPLLVFEASLFADAQALLQSARPILALALPGVAISLLGTAAVATFALRLPFYTSLLLGALLAITDTVSVLLAFRSVRVPRRLAAIMEGESLFNDGTALVLVAVTSNIVMSGHLQIADTVRELGLAIVGGLAIGAAFGAVGYLVLRSTPDHLTAILASAVLVFSTSLIAERWHASAVMAVVVAGLMIGRAAHLILEPSRLLALHGFWETCGFALNVLIFLLVGMQIHADMLVAEAGSIALALLALHAGRAIAVYGCFALLRAFTKDIVPLRWQHVMVVGNVKGALSMAAVLALPESLPYRDRLITIVFGVTFVTLITQALPFRFILRALGVTLDDRNAALDRAKGTLIGARRGQAELDQLLVSGLMSRRDHAERRATFQRTVIEAEEVLRHATPGNEAALVDTALLSAQKAALVDASRRGLITEETAATQINELDDALIRLTNGEH